MSMSRARLAVVSVASLASIVAALGPASPAYAATWSVVTTPNATADRNQLSGIDAVSSTDAWAAGYAYHSTAPFTRPLLMRWNGSSWSLQSTPAQSGDAMFEGVDGDSGSNVWVVGSSGAGPLIERWNGSTWGVVPSPSPSGATAAALRGVKTLAPDNAWAVGTSSHSSGVPTRTMIQRWNGTSWSIVPSPSPDGTQNLLRAVDGVAANDLWAVGGLGHDGYGGNPVASLVLRWNGSAWNQVTIPSSGGAFSVTQLHDVVAVSANDVWMVGEAFSFQYFQMVPYLLHFNGSTWQHATIPNPPLGRFNAVTALSATKVYAVGEGNGPLIARWNGSSWSRETVPGNGYRNLLAACAVGTGTVWAAGIRSESDWVFRTHAVRTTNG